MDKFFFSELIKLAEDTANSVIQILRTGDFHHKRYGQFAITPEVMDSMIANFPGPDRIPLDYNHGSLDSNPEKSKAAGWIKRVYREESEDGQPRLMAEVGFTEQARRHVVEGEFRYISPEFTFNRINTQTGAQQGPTLLAAALTNRPFLQHMMPITLNEDGWIEDQMNKDDLKEVKLSEKIESTLQEQQTKLADESLMDQVRSVTMAFYKQYPDDETTTYNVRDIREDNVVVESMMRSAENKFFQVNYTEGTDNTIVFVPRDQWIEVRKSYSPVVETDSTVETTDLPQQPSIDGAIEGKFSMEKELLELLGLAEDADNSAIATAVTELVDKAEKVDDLNQSLDSLTEKVDALEAENTKLNDSDESELQEENVSLTEENNELTARLTSAEEDNVKLSERLDTLESDKRHREADDRINAALTNRKLLPAEVDGSDAPMRKLALSDPESFDAIIEAKPAYDNAALELVSPDSETKSTVDETDQYWTLWDKLSSENPTLKSHEVRSLIDREHPDVAQAAGLN